MWYFIFMTTISERIIQGRLDRQTEELEMSLRASGQTFESLPLSLGDTTIEREVLPDGTRGDVRICTQESKGLTGSVVVYERFQLKDGQIVTDPSYGEVEQRIKGFRKFRTLAKIALSRVDHWDRESDFYGIAEED
jgi:hypothetical protein